ncbi:MAG TPA: hypothetical protein DEQ40_08070 [Oxalobacteraceae bacterium]|jgi:hypothetical protein|nr:hypothetical protein [Oxalobacteraceae bacterium]
MSRLPNSTTDFVVPVDGIGTFSFAKKSLRDQIAIESEYNRLTEGQDNVTTFLWNIASATASLKVLTIAAPHGWDVDALDPEDPESYINLMKVWGALRDKQASFRQAGKPAVQGEGQAPISDAGVLVPAQVQPGAD